MGTVAVVSGAVAAALVSAAGAFDALVFRVPPALAFVVIPGALCNLVFAVTLVQLGRWGRDDLGSAVRVLAGWLVVCPLLTAAVAYLVRVTSFAGDPMIHDLLAQHGRSIWAVSLHTRFMGDAAIQAVIGVALAGWLLVRAWLRQPRGTPEFSN